MTPLDSVLHAIRAMTLLKESAPSPLQTLVHSLMLVAKSGTGLLMPALSALNYGSPLKAFAHQFPLYATPSMLFQENASLATQVMIFLKVLAFTPAPTMLPQATLDAKLGPKESANNALKNGLSMIKESASLFLISVKLVKDLPAPVASMVMSSTMELVSSHLWTHYHPLMQDVPNGIGMLKFVWHALNSGISITTFVFPSLLFVRLMIILMEIVWPAIKATNSQVEAVPSQLAILHLILDALIGTGMLKSALPALNSGFFVKENARVFLPIVTPTLMLLESALAASRVTDLTAEPARLPLLKALFVNLPMKLDHAWHVITVLLFMEEDVWRLILFLTLHFTTLLAALRNLLNFKPKVDFQNDRTIFIWNISKLKYVKNTSIINNLNIFNFVLLWIDRIIDFKAFHFLSIFYYFSFHN